MTTTDTPRFTVTLLTACKDTKLTKIFHLESGVVKKTAPANLYRGTFETVKISNLETFNDFLNKLSANQALCIGITGSDSKKGDIVSRANKQEGAITRTKDNFKFSNCFIFDLDNSSLAIDDVIPELCKIDPNLSATNILVRPSSSFGITIEGEDTETSLSGYHVWICGVKEPTDIERYGKVFAQRCWLAGMGFIKLSKTGSKLVRQLIDHAVFSPERLVFEAAPILKRGITQLPRPHIIQKGIALNTKSLQSLNTEEQSKYKALVYKAKSAISPESNKVKKSYVEDRVKMAVARGIDGETARRHINTSLESGELYGTHLLYFKDLSTPVTADHILANLTQYDGKTLADPMEPDYNNSYTVAKFFANIDTKNPLVSSFAHGEDKIYKLKRQQSKRVSNFNHTLDANEKYSSIDLLQYLEDEHLLNKMSASIAEATHMPQSTIFMVGMGIFAAVAARKYAVSYRDDGVLPLGLYIVVEQPSGTGKSRCMKYFQSPFFKYQKERIKELSILLEDVNIDPVWEAELNSYKDALTPSLGLTNSTPEALEATLTQTNGYFSAVSCEQGLFNSLFGGSYKTKGQVSNNDTVLNGFDGGHVACTRVSRHGYVGDVVGGIVCFAQNGSINTLLNAASGTGLSERFLMVAEPHSLGRRNHSMESNVDAELLAKYNECCAGVFSDIEQACEIDDLEKMSITDTGHVLISDYRNLIEPHLSDGGQYSYAALRGAVSKANMQIMKIAAILHLLGEDVTQQINGIVIYDKYVTSAIGIVNELLEGTLEICKTKGISGDAAEFNSILSLFVKTNDPRSERYIIKSKTKTHPFKNYTGNKSDKIRATLKLMVEQNLLSLFVDDKGISSYGMAQ